MCACVRAYVLLFFSFFLFGCASAGMLFFLLSNRNTLGELLFSYLCVCVCACVRVSPSFRTPLFFENKVTQHFGLFLFFFVVVGALVI